MFEPFVHVSRSFYVSQTTFIVFDSFFHYTTFFEFHGLALFYWYALSIQQWYVHRSLKVWIKIKNLWV